MAPVADPFNVDITFRRCNCLRCAEFRENKSDVLYLIGIQHRGDNIGITALKELPNHHLVSLEGVRVKFNHWKSFFEKEKKIKHLLEKTSNISNIYNINLSKRRMIIHLTFKRVFSLKALALSAALRHQWEHKSIPHNIFRALQGVKEQFQCQTEGTIQWFVANDTDLLKETEELLSEGPVFALVAINENWYRLKLYANLMLRSRYKGKKGIGLTQNEISKILRFRKVFFN